METIKYVPLYLMAMPQSIITITEAPFVLIPINIIGDIKSIPHIIRGTKFVNLHNFFPRQVNIIFVNHPSYQGGGSSNPQGPPGPRGFGLPMIHLGKSPLPPSKPYRRPLNYLKYVKDSDPNVHVKIFKDVIKTNNETDHAKVNNMFSFTLRNIVFDRCNNYLRDYPICIFAKLHLAFCIRYKKVQNDNQIYMQLKT
jgi:hypothetical protein